MTRRLPPRFALMLLDRLTPDDAPLAGDVIEEFQRGRSRWWLWWQVMGALLVALTRRPSEIRPLRLSEAQPAEAVERTRRLMIHFRNVNLAASPVRAIGGLGLLVIALMVWPAWPLVVTFLTLGLLGGGMAAFVLIERRSPRDGRPDLFPDLRTR